MHKPLYILKILTSILLLFISSCAGNTSTPTPTTEKRINQTRSFSAPSQEILLQAILATLQDQGYNIIKANSNNAEITAQRDGDIIISIVVYPTGTGQFFVRANAQRFTNSNNFFTNNITGYTIITDPVFYQKSFFEPLSKSLFLQKENLPN